MHRLARIVLCVALVASLVPADRAVAVTPIDRDDAGLVASAHHLIVRLWEPVVRLFGAVEDPPGEDGDQASIPAPPGEPLGEGSPDDGAETDGGPGRDPNG